jgi:pSer/pThr/pTyr-binding forkhead associated (FHA) protein
MIVNIRLVDGQLLEYEINAREFTIGRSSRNTISIKHEGLSREHCKIEISTEGEVIVTDLNSTNGVYIDSKRIPANVPTVYSTYLSLTIGPIDRISLELKDFSGLSKNLLAGASFKQHTRPTKEDAGSQDKTGNNSRQSEKNKITIKILLILLGLTIFLLVYVTYIAPGADNELELPTTTPSADF